MTVEPRLGTPSSGSDTDKFETPLPTPLLEQNENPMNSISFNHSALNTTSSPIPVTTATEDKLVEQLKSQILDLTSQVTSLNTKLVDGYTRLGDLEDEVHERLGEENRLKTKVTELEKEKLEREKAIAAGGWVERDHVQAEMQTLMTKVLEETKSKETAVEAHLALETELENLTSSLFTEANRMVAVERYARAMAEEKMKTLEESATDMAGMFGELQVNLRDKVEKYEEKDGEVGDLRRRLALANGGVPVTPTEEKEVDPFHSNGVLFSDGNSVTAAHNALAGAISSPMIPIGSPSLTGGISSPGGTKGSRKQSQHLISSPHTLTSVMPYQEFLAFVTYLRQLRVTVLTKPPDHPSGFPSPYITNSSTITSRSFSSNTINTSPLPYSSAPNSPLPYGSPIPSSPTPPSPAQLLSSYLPLSSHISQPFLKRCLAEDTDPTLRLDLSPGLGFLSRRSIQSAILDGNLIIEPNVVGHKLSSGSCTMCGCGLERWWRGEGEMILSGNEVNENSSGGSGGSTGRAVKNVGGSMLKVLGGGGWGFGSSGRKGSQSSNSSSQAETGLGVTFNPTISISSPSLPTNDNSDPSANPFVFPTLLSQQIHIFRTSETSSSRYAICPTYCLPRLRSVCEFWTYVRVVERGLLLEEGFRFAGRNGTKKRSSTLDTEGEVQKSQEGVRDKVVVNGEEEITATFAGVDQEEKEIKPIVEKSDITAVEDSKPIESTVLPTSNPEASASTTSITDSSIEPTPMSPSNSTQTRSTSKPTIPPRSGARSTPNLPTSSSIEGLASAASTSSVNLVTVTAASSPLQSRSASPNPGNIGNNSSPNLTPFRPKLPSRRSSSRKNGSNTLGGIIDSVGGWEDRCWTEVVRLKEKMFWSRITGSGNSGDEV